MAFEPKESVEGESPEVEVDAASELSSAKASLQKLSDLIAKSDDDADKETIQNILSGLTTLESSLGSSPDEAEPSAKPVGRLTAEAGSKNVKPAF